MKNYPTKRLFKNVANKKPKDNCTNKISERDNKKIYDLHSTDNEQVKFIKRDLQIL